jgi:hypothetical protein
VVAEGIETNTTWRQVADLGCEMVQGYALARPMPGDDLMIWLRDAIGPASDSTDLSGGRRWCRSGDPRQLWLVSSAEGAREAEVLRHRGLEPGDLTDPFTGEADHFDPGEV